MTVCDVLTLDGCTAYVVMVDPFAHDSAPDLFEPWHEQDLALWLVWEALHCRTLRMLHRVHRDIDDWPEGDLKLHADVAIMGALFHSDTPFGIGYRAEGDASAPMLVLFRDRAYTRARNGVLTRIAGHGIWPTEQEMHVTLANAGMTPEDVVQLRDELLIGQRRREDHP